MDKNQARHELLCILEQVNIPSGWKMMLDLEEGQREIRIAFYKKNGISFRIKGQTCHLGYWHLVRQICGYDYEDLLYKVNKYPELLETEIVFNGNISNE